MMQRSICARNRRRRLTGCGPSLKGSFKDKVTINYIVAATACLPAVFLAGPDNIFKDYREAVAGVSDTTP
jgi:hypothetical protein